MPWRETCPMEQRMAFILDHSREELSMAELCRQYEISRKTGYKWLSRYAAEGLAGLEDRSRAPRCHPQAVPDEVREAVLAVRHGHPSWGPRKVRAWLARHRPEGSWPAASTMGDLFRRHGLVRPRRRRYRAPPRTAPFATAGSANDVWTVDFKGWFRTGDGARCDPLTLQDAASRYLLRCVGLERTDEAHVWAVFDAVFRELGLPLVLRSDNGPPFASVALGGLSPLAVKLVKAGVLPERIDPASPQQNGRHERMHLTLKQETASPPAASLRAQARRFEDFVRDYNEARPHEALGQTLPADHYQASPRRYSGRLRAPDYGDGWQVRRVRHNGEIKWRGDCIYISESLTGEPIGLDEQEDGTWVLYFGPVHLGQLDQAGQVQRPAARRRRHKPASRGV
jgi:putative transposase